MVYVIEDHDVEGICRCTDLAIEVLEDNEQESCADVELTENDGILQPDQRPTDGIQAEQFVRRRGRKVHG